jgi:ribosome recycling factor
MGQRADQLNETQESDDALAAGDAAIQQTREDMSETLEAIQEKLSPEHMTDDARDAAIETANRVIEDAKAAIEELTERASVATSEAVDNALVRLRDMLPELNQQAQESMRGASELASVAAMEAVDHALEKVREAMPDLTQQAQDAARVAVDHAIEEAKSALRELGAQTRAAVRDATIGKVERMAHTTNETTKRTGSTVMETIKQNPGPTALTALGATWLLMNGRSSGSKAHTSKVDSPSSGLGGTGLNERVQAGTEQAKDLAGNMAHQVQDGVGTVADGAVQGAEAVASGVSQGAETVASTVSQAAGTVVSDVQSTVVGASSRVKHMPSRLRHMVEANPVPLGLVGIALGSAVALAVPETRRENQLLGEARDTVVGRAQATAQDTLQKVQHVAGEVGETVEKEAKYAGLTKDDSTS